MVEVVCSCAPHQQPRCAHFRMGACPRKDTPPMTPTPTPAGDIPPLREYLKLKYMGDCKCGKCSLVPDRVLQFYADQLEIFEKLAGNEGVKLLAALRSQLEAVEKERERWKHNHDDVVRKKREADEYKTQFRARALAAERGLAEARKALEAAGRVLIRADSVITTDRVGQRFRHVFADDLDALGSALATSAVSDAERS